MASCLGEQLDISQVMDLKKKLQEDLQKKGDMLLDGSSVSRVDATGLQLLLCVKNQCLHLSKNWRWLAASNELIEGAKNIGLFHSLALNDFAQ